MFFLPKPLFAAGKAPCSGSHLRAHLSAQAAQRDSSPHSHGAQEKGDSTGRESRDPSQKAEGVPTADHGHSSCTPGPVA